MIISYSNGTDKIVFGRSFKVKLLYFIAISVAWENKSAFGCKYSNFSCFHVVTLTNRNQIIQISCDEHISDQRRI